MLDDGERWQCPKCGPDQCEFAQSVSVSSWIVYDERGEAEEYGPWEDTDYYGDMECSRCTTRAEVTPIDGLTQLDEAVDAGDDDAPEPEPPRPAMSPLAVITWIMNWNNTLSTSEHEQLGATRAELLADAEGEIDPICGD